MFVGKVYNKMTISHMCISYVYFTCERISHEITCDISHVKGFHMKSRVTFHM